MQQDAYVLGGEPSRQIVADLEAALRECHAEIAGAVGRGIDAAAAKLFRPRVDDGVTW